MSLLLALSLILNGGAADKPAEDSVLTDVAITFAEAVFPGSDSQFTPVNKNKTLIGSTFTGPGGIECFAGIEWRRGQVQPFSVECP
jgi:hypothetical protein